MTTTRPLTLADRELQQTTNPIIIEQLRAALWLCLDKDHCKDVLFTDAGDRDTLIQGESFKESPEYLAIPAKLLHDDCTVKTAFAEFILRVLFNGNKEKYQNEFPRLEKYFNQYLNGVFITAISQNLLSDGNNFESEKLPNIYRNDDGNIFLETVHYNLNMSNTELLDEACQPLKTRIPGIITSRFILTPDGFQLESVEFSNALLKNLCLQKDVKFTTKLLNQAYAEEQQEFATAITQNINEKLKTLASCIDKFMRTKNDGKYSEHALKSEKINPQFASIPSLLKKLLMESCSDTVLLAFERLIRKADMQDDELVVDLYEQMEAFLSEYRLENTFEPVEVQAYDLWISAKNESQIDDSEYQKFMFFETAEEELQEELLEELSVPASLASVQTNTLNN